MSRSWIQEAVGGAAVFDRLATEMNGTELWSVLMEVARERARRRVPAEVLAQYRRDAFVRPAPVDQRLLVALDAQLLAAASDFEALALSPVAPLATCSSVAPTDQHRVLSALRGTEVVSDPTNVLALACSERLTREPARVVRLCTSQRVVRAQQLPKQPGFTQHFQIFVLATGGRERKDHALLVEGLVEHIRTMLAALERLEAHGYAFGARRVDVLATPERSAVADRIASALDGVSTQRRALEHAYYSGGLRFTLWVHDRAGNELPLIDGGAFDWLARLSSNARHVFLASGMGAQLAALRCRVGANQG
jgi:hypothetical protein